MTLHSAGHRRGAVSAPHYATVEAGRFVLPKVERHRGHVGDGGIDRRRLSHMNHVGGDGFWLVREPSGRVRALMGAGPAGSRATVGFYPTKAMTRSRHVDRSPR